nr:YkgJ family cysteine cluster protein [Candidatus Levybacteria bacterium]
MFFIYLSKKQLKTLTPENTHVVKFDSVLDLPSRKDLKFMQNGVYYAESAESSYYAAAIAGPCANLGQDGECLVYQERPTHCRRFETGSSDCDKARQKDGLVPVQELIQLSPRI